ncbi:hypothetical protein [Castellaniella sp.]|nr:hypothetical protein [Castellaniella sp.]
MDIEKLDVLFGNLAALWRCDYHFHHAALIYQDIPALFGGSEAGSGALR